MKKIVRIFLAILMCCVCIGIFAACQNKDNNAAGGNNLDGYQGNYECVYLYSNGVEADIDETYEHYTVSLDGKGGMTTSYQLKGGSSATTVKGEYRIEGSVFYEIVDGVTNEYKIENRVITMKYEGQGMNLEVRFEKAN